MCSWLSSAMTIYPNQLNSTQVIVVKKSMSLFQESPRKSDFMQVQATSTSRTRCSASKFIIGFIERARENAATHNIVEGRMTTALRSTM